MQLLMDLLTKSQKKAEMAVLDTALFYIMMIKKLLLLVVDEVALLQKAKIHTMGRYVAVAVTDDTDNANKVIDRYFA